MLHTILRFLFYSLCNIDMKSKSSNNYFTMVLLEWALEKSWKQDAL